MTLTSIREVATAAGTSSATVSRVLNHDQSFSVSRETAARVWATAERLGYIKSKQNLQTLQIVTTQTRAMEVNDPYFRMIRLALEEQAVQWQMQIASTIRINQQEKNIPDVTVLKERGGVVVIGGFTQQAITALAQVNQNLVVIDNPYLPAGIDGVYADLFGFTKQLMTQLYQHFTGTIAFIGGPLAATQLDGTQVVNQQEVRYQAYLQVTQAAQRPVSAQLTGWTAKTGTAAVDWFLKQKPRPQVVVVASDPIAIGFIHGLTAHLALKDFPKIVSFDDSEMAAYTTPSLSSIQIPTHLFGRTALQLLMERLNGERDFAARVILEPKLSYRDSLLSFDMGRIDAEK